MAEIHGQLNDFCRGKKHGWLLPADAGYQCFPDDPGKVRRPDISFISLERISLVQALEEGYITIAPDLAVEVVSPNDNLYDLDEKVQEVLTGRRASGVGRESAGAHCRSPSLERHWNDLARTG